MQLDDIKTTLYKLEKLMYGYNFEVVFGIELFENCNSYEDLKPKLKLSFPDSRPEQTTIIEIDHLSFWEEIYDCLNYRGGKGAGLFLDDENQQQLDAQQKKYINYLADFITPQSRIFSYPDQKGIPGYPVWWDYIFIIFQESGQCLFIYGSASD